MNGASPAPTISFQEDPDDVLPAWWGCGAQSAERGQGRWGQCIGSRSTHHRSDDDDHEQRGSNHPHRPASDVCRGEALLTRRGIVLAGRQED